MVIMDCDDDKEKIDEFLPKQSTIGRRRRSRSKSNKSKKKKKIDPDVELKITPAMQTFGVSDPFKNATEFVSFYRSIVRSYSDRRVDFPAHGADREYASFVMDDLIDSGREKDIDFLREWIKYYAQFKLKETDFEDYAKTSIREFQKTLVEYTKKHIDV